jgi:hypothetical protein
MQVFGNDYDHKKFTNDIKIYREWFRCREAKDKDKFDYFYGPFEKNYEKVKNINK